MSGYCQASDRQMARRAVRASRGPAGRDRRSDSRKDHAARPAGGGRDSAGAYWSTQCPLDQRQSRCVRTARRRASPQCVRRQGTHPGREPIALAGLRVECDAKFRSCSTAFHTAARVTDRSAASASPETKARSSSRWKTRCSGLSVDADFTAAGVEQPQLVCTGLGARAHASHVALCVDHEHGAGQRKAQLRSDCAPSRSSR